jgi:hypothetical protein
MKPGSNSTAIEFGRGGGFPLCRASRQAASNVIFPNPPSEGLSFWRTVKGCVKRQQKAPRGTTGLKWRTKLNRTGDYRSAWSILLCDILVRRSAQQLRQLSNVAGDAPSLVHGKKRPQEGRPEAASISGEAGYRGLRFCPEKRPPRESEF